VYTAVSRLLKKSSLMEGNNVCSDFVLANWEMSMMMLMKLCKFREHRQGPWISWSILTLVGRRRLGKILDTVENAHLYAVSLRRGHTNMPETSASGKQSVNYLFTHIPSVLTVDAGEQRRRWTFLASIHVHEEQAFEALYEGV
jgi:hypothetical protein